MTKTNVLFVIANTEYGGGHRTYEIIAQGLPREEFSLHVACDARGLFWEKMAQLGVCRHAVPFDRTWGAGRVAVLTKIICEESIALVHSASRRADFYALLAARRARVPIVSSVAIRTEAFDVSPVHNWAYRRIEAWMERRFDCQIAVSKEVEQALLASGLPRERVVQIPEVVEASRLSQQVMDKRRACERLGVDPATRWVGTIGRLIPMKGQRVLLESAARLADLPRVGFLIAGTGPMESELKSMAQTLGLESRVRFLSFVEDAAQFFSALDLFAFCSVFSEAFPRVLLEAMAFAKPIVASDLPASLSVMGEAPFARYVPAGDAHALAAAIREMLQDPSRLEALGRLGQQYVLEHYDVPPFIARVVDVYRSLRRAASQGEKGA